jgi:hypothetical protein
MKNKASPLSQSYSTDFGRSESFSFSSHHYKPIPKKPSMFSIESHSRHRSQDLSLFLQK